MTDPTAKGAESTTSTGHCSSSRSGPERPATRAATRPAQETGYETEFGPYEMFGESADSRETASQRTARDQQRGRAGPLPRELPQQGGLGRQEFAWSDDGGGRRRHQGRGEAGLPQLGQIAGDFVAPGVGGAIGAKAGNWLGSRVELGLELEGLSGEDREFETAKAVLRFGEEAAQRAAQAASSSPAAAPLQVARSAAMAAAQNHLPGLVQSGAAQPGRAGANGANGARAERPSGEWIRRGRRIVLLDVGSGGRDVRTHRDASGRGAGRRLAAELLEVTSEQELEDFLGSLASSVIKGAKSFMKSGVGKAVGGALRSIAKTALPAVGGAWARSSCRGWAPRSVPGSARSPAACWRSARPRHSARRRPSTRPRSATCASPAPPTSTPLGRRGTLHLGRSRGPRR